MATTVAISTMKVAQIGKPGAGFQVVERESSDAGCRTSADQGAGLRGLPQ